jgi:hypothetical protein
MSVEEMITRVQVSLEHMLNPTNSVRKEHEKYLTSLEDQNTLGLVNCLTRIISQPSNAQLSYMALICLKNVINRKWQYSGRKLFTEKQAAGIGDECKPAIREYVLDLFKKSDQKMYTDQVVEIISSISRYDFPAKWTELVKLFYEYMEQSKQIIPLLGSQMLQPQHALTFQKGIMLMKKTLKEQNELKFRIRKCEFIKIAPQFIQEVYNVVALANKLLENMSNFLANPYLAQSVEACSELEIIILYSISNGFNPHDLINEDPTNTKGYQYILLIETISKKMLGMAQLFQSILNATPANKQEECNKTALINSITKMLKHLIIAMVDLQFSEPVLLMNCLKEYIQILYAFIVSLNGSVCEDLVKACMFGLYKIFDTALYTEDLDQSKLSGVLASPAKLKIFEKHLAKAKKDFKEFFNANNLFQLISQIISKYLVQRDYDKWMNSEEFAEEDEDIMNITYQPSVECTMSQLGYILIEQITLCFNPIASAFYKTHLNTMMTTDCNNSEACIIEDSILHGLQAFPFAYKMKQVTDIINIEMVLTYIENRINLCMNNASPYLKLWALVLMRRYSLLLRNWYDQMESILIIRGESGEIHY